MDVPDIYLIVRMHCGQTVTGPPFSPSSWMTLDKWLSFSVSLFPHQYCELIWRLLCINTCKVIISEPLHNIIPKIWSISGCFFKNLESTGGDRGRESPSTGSLSQCLYRQGGARPKLLEVREGLIGVRGPSTWAIIGCLQHSPTGC